MSRPIHPEAAAHEILIGNMFAADFRRVGWTTKRLGKVAYEASGKVIQNFRPVFVARYEVESAGVEIPDSGAVDHRW